jgi:sortase A
MVTETASVSPVPDTPVSPSGPLTELRPTQDPLTPTQNPAQPTPTLSKGEVDVSYLLPTATPLNLPHFDIPTPTAMPATGPDGGAPDSSAVTRLVIPKMGLDTVVEYVPFNGSTWLISGLHQEIAWMGDTSWPGLGGNTGLAGHVDLVTGAKGPFWNLKDLKTGDQITLYTEKNIYTYQVREQTVVEDYDLSVIQPTDKPQLTLITCTTWDPDLRMYIKRLVVYADLANVHPQTSQSN